MSRLVIRDSDINVAAKIFGNQCHVDADNGKDLYTCSAGCEDARKHQTNKIQRCVKLSNEVMRHSICIHLI